MENIFFVAFVIGIIYTVVSFLLGTVISFGDLNTELEFDINWDDIGFFDVPISPLKPIIIASFITVFGVIGLIIYKYYKFPMILSIIIAFTAALIISFLIYHFIVIPLYRTQNRMVHDINELSDKSAIVLSSIYGNKYGKIRYTIEEGVYSGPARSVDGRDIKQGESALIVKIEKNVFFVERVNKDIMVNIPE